MAERLDHFYDSIPGWFDWQDVYAGFVQAAPDSGAHFVEVGAWKGRSAAFMAVEIANSGKAIRFDVVDTWQGSNEEIHQSDPDVQAGRLYDVFLANTAPVRQYVRPIRSTSVEAASTYADGSLHAVYLDADHTTDAALADMQAWWPKIAPGGVLAGHDRQWDSVKRAIHAFGQFAGVRVRPVSGSSWVFEKPAQITDWAVAEPDRAVLIAVCSNERSIYRQTAKSLLECLAGPQIQAQVREAGFQDYDIAWIDKYPSVAAMRDYALMQAQRMGGSHVLFLDADMTWPKDMLARMLRHHSIGMVSGVYHLKAWPYWPVILERPFVNNEQREITTPDGDKDMLPPSYMVEYHYTQDVSDKESPMQRVDLIGMGCALVPVRVTDGWKRPWFEYMPDNHGLPAVTEDVAFCARARAVGCPIWVDPSVQCGHIGQQIITPAWHKRALIEREMLAKLREEGTDVQGFDALFGAAADRGSAA